MRNYEYNEEFNNDVENHDLDVIGMNVQNQEMK